MAAMRNINKLFGTNSRYLMSLEQLSPSWFQHLFQFNLDLFKRNAHKSGVKNSFFTKNFPPSGIWLLALAGCIENKILISGSFKTHHQFLANFRISLISKNDYTPSGRQYVQPMDKMSENKQVFRHLADVLFFQVIYAKVFNTASRHPGQLPATFKTP